VRALALGIVGTDIREPLNRRPMGYWGARWTAFLNRSAFARLNAMGLVRVASCVIPAVTFVDACQGFFAAALLRSRQ